MPRTIERFTFTNGAGVELAASLDRPAGEPLGWAMLAHCFTCTQDSPAAARVSRALADRGWAVLRFDFTGLGGSQGDFGNSSFSGNVDDLLAAARALEDRGGAPSLLVGHSLGGAAVLAAALRLKGVRAVATIGAPADPRHVEELLGAAVGEIEDQGSAEVSIGGRPFRIGRGLLDDLREQSLPEGLERLRAALMLFHSPVDNVVGIAHAKRLFAAARHPKSFVSLGQADHLLSEPRDAEMVAAILAGWACRWLPDREGHEDGSEAPAGPSVPRGEVLVVEGSARHAQRIVAGPHQLAADEPVSAGGRDTGTTPYDLLLAGLGACTSMTLRMYADHKGWPLEHVEVRLKHERIHAEDCASCETATGKVSRVERIVRIDGDLDESQRARLLEIADRCPVHRTLVEEKEIVTRLAEDGA